MNITRTLLSPGFMLISFVALTGCISMPKSFVSDGDVLVHQPTGVRYPKRISDWHLLEGATDRVDSEIAAAGSYQKNEIFKASIGKFVPFTTVYVLNSKNTNGVALIEARLRKMAPGAVSEGTKTLTTDAGPVTASVYKHMGAVSQGSIVATGFNAESWIMKFPGQPQLVFWVTIDKDQAEEATAPTEFVNHFAQALTPTPKATAQAH